MKIIVVGATGTIGSAVVKALEEDHTIVKVGNSRGDINVDLASSDSIEKLFKQTGNFDGLISAAGLARFGRLDELTEDDYLFGLRHKLLGQVKLYLIGRKYINDNGSFTLTSGMLSSYPMPGSTSISMVNGGINSFVMAAALEVERGTRINAVSPGWVKETMEAMGMDSSSGTPAETVALAYKESLLSLRNGDIIDMSIISKLTS